MSMGSKVAIMNFVEISPNEKRVFGYCLFDSNMRRWVTRRCSSVAFWAPYVIVIPETNSIFVFNTPEDISRSLFEFYGFGLAHSYLCGFETWSKRQM